MTKLIFLPEMFRKLNDLKEIKWTEDRAAYVAQEIHDEWLEENGQVVYKKGAIEPHLSLWGDFSKNDELYTHKALLINLEELTNTHYIKPIPSILCEHKRIKLFTLTENTGIENVAQYFCRDCNKELHPKVWEVVGE